VHVIKIVIKNLKKEKMVFKKVFLREFPSARWVSLTSEIHSLQNANSCKTERLRHLLQGYMTHIAATIAHKFNTKVMSESRIIFPAFCMSRILSVAFSASPVKPMPILGLLWSSLCSEVSFLLERPSYSWVFKFVETINLGSMQGLCPEPRLGLSAILRFTLENRWW